MQRTSSDASFEALPFYPDFSAFRPAELFGHAVTVNDQPQIVACSNATNPVRKCRPFDTPALTPAASARHVGLNQGFVDKDNLVRVKRMRMGLPPHPLDPDTFGWSCSLATNVFFKALPSARRNRQNVLWNMSVPKALRCVDSARTGRSDLTWSR
jgi:hypothetical protein